MVYINISFSGALHIMGFLHMINRVKASWNAKPFSGEAIGDKRG